MTVTALSLLSLAGFVALRDRAWRSAALLFGAGVMSCGADAPTVTVGGGAAGGRYVETCGPARHFQTAAVEAEYRHPITPSLEFTAEVQLSQGLDVEDVPSEPVIDPSWRRTQLSIGLRPMLGLDSPYLGGAVGITLGPLVLDGDQGFAFPAARLRVGPRSLAFLDGAINDSLMGSLPAGWLQITAGVGLPPKLDAAWNHPILQVGIADTGFLAATAVPLGEHGQLEAIGTYGDTNTWRMGLGMRWRFGG